MILYATQKKSVDFIGAESNLNGKHLRGCEASLVWIYSLGWHYTLNWWTRYVRIYMYHSRLSHSPNVAFIVLICCRWSLINDLDGFEIYVVSVPVPSTPSLSSSSFVIWRKEGEKSGWLPSYGGASQHHFPRVFFFSSQNQMAIPIHFITRTRRSPVVWIPFVLALAVHWRS